MAVSKKAKKASAKKASAKKVSAKKVGAKKVGVKAAKGKASAKKVPRKSASKKPQKGKAAGKKHTAKAAKGVAKSPARSESGGRITIRMYRQGLGDCFLISIPREDADPYRIVIDCGVILGTPDASKIIREVVEDIIQTTGGHIDLLAATHEHWDHVSGFVQARELWTDASRLQIDKVWMAWTEDADDCLGKQLRGERNALRVALTAASTRLRISGDHRGADEVGNLLGFFGAAGDNSTAAALEVVRRLAGTPRYCHPQEPPFTIPGTDVKVYVLGPPHDEKFIKKYNPSKRQPETYGLAASEAFFRVVAPTLNEDGKTDSPFDEAVEIPLDAAQQSPFFQQHYWGEATTDEDDDSAARDQSWRRIDGSWLDASSPLALQLDSATNNTSLVLAFELASGEVFLFAADAQVGNWMSWQELSWTVDGRTVTGPDLLHRTVFYKVGHHGSHNATLREHGLEEMSKSLEVAFIPVNRAMAIKKRWGRMPLSEIVERLNEVTEGKVVLSDEPVPPGLKDRVRADGLYYEISF